MRQIDADALKYAFKIEQNLGIGDYEDAIEIVDCAPTVDALPVKHVITVLMDLRDAFVAKQPRGEWHKSDRAKGIEQGIEMAIEKVREMAERREDG